MSFDIDSMERATKMVYYPRDNIEVVLEKIRQKGIMARL